MWIDSHCHLDAEEFDTDREQVVERAQAAGVQMMLIPAVEVSEFERLRGVAHRFGFEHDRRLHCHEREHLQNVVLKHVAQGARFLVITTTPADAEFFAHRDLHVVNGIAVP